MKITVDDLRKEYFHIVNLSYETQCDIEDLVDKSNLADALIINLVGELGHEKSVITTHLAFALIVGYNLGLKAQQSDTPRFNPTMQDFYDKVYK